MFITARAGPSRLKAITGAPKIVKSRVPPACLCRHNSSAAPPSQSPKICALPFRLSPEDAAEKMRRLGIVSSMRPKDYLWLILVSRAAAFLRWLPIPLPSFTRLASRLGWGDHFRLKQIKACYWPVWRYDLVLSGKVGCISGGERRTEGKGWFGIFDGFLPGNAFAPLSYLPLGPLTWLDSNAGPPEDLETYDPEKHLKQLGDDMEIVPIPFTVSPFGTMKRARELVGTRRQWEGVTVDESKWIETMFVCWPLMFPVYIAEFEYDFEGETVSFTNVLGANHSDPEKCNGQSPMSPSFFKAKDDGLSGGALDMITRHYWFGGLKQDFATLAMLQHPAVQRSMSLAELRATKKVDGLISELLPIPEIDNQEVQRAMREWLSPAPRSADFVPPSPLLTVQQEYADGEEPSSINWDDPRVRRWSEAEKKMSGQYWGATGGAYTQLRLADRLEEIMGDDSIKVMWDPGNGQPPEEISAAKHVSDRRRQAIEERDKKMPAWLKEIRDRERDTFWDPKSPEALQPAGTAKRPAARRARVPKTRMRAGSDLRGSR